MIIFDILRSIFTTDTTKNHEGNTKTNHHPDNHRLIPVMQNYGQSTVLSKGRHANPEEIINGSVNWKDGDPSTKRILGGSIIEIECDTEEKRNIL